MVFVDLIFFLLFVVFCVEAYKALAAGNALIELYLLMEVEDGAYFLLLYRALGLFVLVEYTTTIVLDFLKHSF